MQADMSTAPPPDVQRLLARATRLETPCGSGSMVRHRWQPDPASAGAPHRPVVLLHGGSGSWTHWLRITALALALQSAPHFRGMHWIDNAGHWVQFEQPQAFDAVLRAVLDESLAS